MATFTNKIESPLCIVWFTEEEQKTSFKRSTEMYDLFDNLKGEVPEWFLLENIGFEWS